MIFHGNLKWVCQNLARGEISLLTVATRCKNWDHCYWKKPLLLWRKKHLWMEKSADIMVFQTDCYHLHNLRIGAMSKWLSKYLDDMLSCDLSSVDFCYRVLTNFYAVLCAMNKELHLPTTPKNMVVSLALAFVIPSWSMTCFMHHGFKKRHGHQCHCCSFLEQKIYYQVPKRSPSIT